MSPSSVLGTLPVSYLAAELGFVSAPSTVPCTCDSSRALAELGCDFLRISDTSTVLYISTLVHSPSQAFPSALAVAAALYSQQCHPDGGAKLQDRASAEPVGTKCCKTWSPVF